MQKRLCKVHLLPGSRYEKVRKLMVHFHCLRIRGDGPIFSGIARRQER